METRDPAPPTENLAPAPAADATVAPTVAESAPEPQKENPLESAALTAVANALRAAVALAVEARGLAVKEAVATAPKSAPPTALEVPSDALSAALMLARHPSMAKVARESPLPDEMVELARIVGGSTESLARAVWTSGKDPFFIKAAAIFYVEQVLLAGGDDARRTLGVAPGASEAMVTEHARWLLAWLLPRLGNSDREGDFAERVVRSWIALLDEMRQSPTPALHPYRPIAPAPEPRPREVVGGAQTARPNNWLRPLALGAALAVLIFAGIAVSNFVHSGQGTGGLPPQGQSVSDAGQAPRTSDSPAVQ